MYQKELRKKYNQDNLFKKSTKQEEKIEQTMINEVAMIKYEESLLKKYVTGYGVYLKDKITIVYFTIA